MKEIMQSFVVQMISFPARTVSHGITQCFLGIKVDRCLFHNQFDSFWTTVLFFSRSVISLHWVRILSRLLFDFSPRLVFGTLNAVLNHATVRARPSQRYVWLKDFDFMLKLIFYWKLYRFQGIFRDLLIFSIYSHPQNDEPNHCPSILHVTYILLDIN